MNERLNTLFKKQQLQENSSEEKEELLKLMADQANEHQINELLKTHWDGMNEDHDLITPIFQPGQGEKMLTKLLTEQVYPSQATVKKIKLWPRFRIAVAAAATVAIVGVSLYFYTSSNRLTPTASRLAQSDIKPGKRSATLTLANGKKIKLSDAASGELAEEAGIEIKKSANGRLSYVISGSRSDERTNQLNTLKTEKGETYEVSFPDGTRVLLNAASSLTYSTNLIKDGKRTVKLEGEGYFEVAKDKAHPFIVQSRGQEVKVLGTHFNLNTYADEPEMITTLLEGAVEVTRDNDKKRIKPGEQAISNSSGIRIGIANMDQVMGWTKGDFYLNHVNFKAAMRDIARWYNVDVIYDASVPNDMESGGWIARDKPLSAVLKSMESSGLVKFKVEGRKIFVTQ